MRRPLNLSSSRRRDRLRRRQRRQVPDRRTRLARWVGEERRLSVRRMADDRRLEAPSSYYPEEEDRIRRFVAGWAGKNPEGRLSITCPRCRGGLSFRRAVQWKGGVSVWEVRCDGCPRRTYWREWCENGPQPDRR